MGKPKGQTKANTSRAPVAAPASQDMGWGLRYHAGRLRTALFFLVVAAGIVVCFGQGGSLGAWFLRDQYVATRASVVKAPYWADALDPQPDPYGAIAGWHVDLKVADYPFSLAVALSDLDPSRNYVGKDTPPDAAKFAAGSTHPVWFYADARWKAPETVSLIERPPALLIGRAAFPRFPTLAEAFEDSDALPIVCGGALALAAIFLVLTVYGRRGGETAGEAFSVRASKGFVALLVAGGAYVINNDHPLTGDEARYVPAEIIVTREPYPDDKLSHYAGYRLVWRTWRLDARLADAKGTEFSIDVDGLDPHRVPWASRHSPDFSALQPGTRLPVWRSPFHSSNLDGITTHKQSLYWEAFLSRERWPNRYTWREFIQDSPLAVAFMATCLALAVVFLIPLGGRRAKD
ncbi:MAG: hypothetical protein JNK75_08035 [Betaproteobacteria bacterium]|nr:hypothetical protein [Betaproteobacteria bacterium]